MYSRVDIIVDISDVPFLVYWFTASGCQLSVSVIYQVSSLNWKLHVLSLHSVLFFIILHHADVIEVVIL